MMDKFNHYEVLGVEPNASTKDIKKAYRILAMKYHPDVSTDPDCVSKFRAITEAYEVLSDEEKRRVYDTEYTVRNGFYQDEFTGTLDQTILDLISLLNAPESYVRNAAVDELVSIGKPAFIFVKEAALSSDEVIRRKVCDILGRMGDPRGVIPLLALLNDPDVYVRRRAANALIYIGEENAVEALVNSLKDSESVVRARAAEALGNIKDERAVEPLIIILEDSDQEVKDKALDALKKIGWEPSNDALSAKYWIALRRWDKCGEIGKEAVYPLIDILNHHSSDVRNKAASTLASIGSEAFSIILSKSRNSDIVVRRKICDVLGLMKDPRGIDPLLRLLIDSDVYVRRRAANALIKLHDERAVLPLIRALKDPESKVRARAAEALGNIKDKRAVDPLIDTLKDRKNEVRYASVVALGEIGNSKAIKPLQELSNVYNPIRPIAIKTLEEKFNISYHESKRYTQNNLYKKKRNPTESEIYIESILDAGKDVVNDLDVVLKDLTTWNTKSKKPREISACPHCSNEIDLNTNFCTKCGNPTNEAKKNCPHCSHENPYYANFCAECGQPMDSIKNKI